MTDPSAGTGELVTGRLILRPWSAAADSSSKAWRSATEREIAYLFGSQWCGRGYATEAAAAIRDHARGVLGFDRLISPIDPGNTPSQAVARRIGMHHERDLLFEGRPTSLYSTEGAGSPHERAANVRGGRTADGRVLPARVWDAGDWNQRQGGWAHAAHPGAEDRAHPEVRCE